MKKSAVIEYFGSVKAVATALGISQAAVSQWDEDVPRSREWELQFKSGGALKAGQSADQTEGATA